MAGERLAQLIATNRNTMTRSNFVFGEVKSVSPIEITVDGLPTIIEDMIILGKNVREYKAYKDSHSHPTVSSASDFVIVNRGLQVGDKVFMIRSNDGQKFYVAERLTE